MARKEHTYRGKTVKELQELSLEEFIDLLPAREKRTANRMSDELKQLYEKTQERDNVKTHHREMIVFPHMVGKVIKVHNGKEFIDVHIIPEMVGMRLGQLVLTRKGVKHGGPGVGATKSSAAATVR
ncbi:ribosomal protein S19 family protein [Candidatus Woesearchaeota archaeon]|nr:ribosomal protein S19 family protein [Candidatus Woesearchaeota archaeon]